MATSSFSASFGALRSEAVCSNAAAGFLLGGMTKGNWTVGVYKDPSRRRIKVKARAWLVEKRHADATRACQIGPGAAIQEYLN